MSKMRGVHEPAGSLTGEVGMAVFEVVLERWGGDTNRRDPSELICESLSTN